MKMITIQFFKVRKEVKVVSNKMNEQELNNVRNIEGYPIGLDEDIIQLSDGRAYTSCPNPFMADFVREFGTPFDEETDRYQREPYAADVAEDKHDLIYNIHSYHTKVPPKAIKNFIEYYTEPGDIVLDSFCGTGMTGVAAKICDDAGAGRSQRHAILLDLSTIATFIAGNYNKPLDDTDVLEIEAKLDQLRKIVGEYYLTEHVQNGKVVTGINNQPIMGEINYTVWSDVFICPHCSEELVYYDVAVDKKTNKTQKEFDCPCCGLKLTKAKCDRAVQMDIDPITGVPFKVTKAVPVLINYSVGKTRFNKKPDTRDMSKIDTIRVDYSSLPNGNIVFESGDKTTEMFRGNLKYIWQIYRSRTLYAIQHYLEGDTTLKEMFLLTSALPKLTILNRFMPEHGSRALVGPMAGTFYLPAMAVENNVIHQLEFQFKKLKNLHYQNSESLVSTQSATDLSQIDDDSVDYVFVDPPFGANIMYSELNILSESWLKVFTNNSMEAIMNITQGKGLLEYQGLMERSFAELFRVLKPNRWITIEFHNSKNSVWNAIQEAINKAGFIIADVRTLNKEKKTINQFNARGCVDQDLVISAYKPKDALRRIFHNKTGSEDTAWAFVRQHLSNLPIVVDSDNDGKIDILSERQAILLFDRMVSYHIMQGYAVPLDAADFYRGLDERFLKRDGMYFLSDQVNEYDMARSTMEVENIQFSLFVSDEKSAIGWLYQQLDENSGSGRMTYAELQPKFMKELQAVDKREKMPELMEILEENFLKDDDGKWYTPDLTKSGDLAKLREKNLLREFQSYLESKGKLKVFRSEAIRSGFAKLWKDKDYKSIVAVAERLPEATIQEDPNLLMYYDISLSRV